MIDVRPRGAHVSIDGKISARFAAETAVLLTPGRHRVRAELDGHEPAEATVTVAPLEEVQTKASFWKKGLLPWPTMTAPLPEASYATLENIPPGMSPMDCIPVTEVQAKEP